MANNTLAVNNLDYTGLRSNLVSFLQNYPQFQDYNFEGSNLSTLIDLMAYNTYINSFYTNMVMNEMFMDTAVLRDSVISHAKDINYLPRSARSSVAYLNLTVYPTNNPTSVYIPTGAQFLGTNGLYTFTFSTIQDTYIVPVNNTYSISNVAVYEGINLQESFVVNNAIVDQRYILSNPNIDTTSLSVYVSNTSGQYEQWTYYSSLLGVTTTTKSYFLQATGDRYELIFGDGVTGLAPVNGSTIQAKYRICNLDTPNGLTKFTSAGNLGGYSNFVVSAMTNVNGSPVGSYGGAQPESTSSIRYNAPRAYQTLDRAVTIEDYRNIIFSAYPDVRDLHVYGGEEVSPPQYGKVYIAVDVNGAIGLSDVEKSSIQAFVKTKMPVSLAPVIVEPSYTYVTVTTNILYNLNKSTLAPTDIQIKVLNSILAYNATNLNLFNTTVRYSKIAAAIDASDPSITSSETYLKFFDKLVPTLGVNYSTTVNYQNPIVPGSISSTTFTYKNTTASFIDDGSGNLQVAAYINNVITSIYNIGTVDYVNGIVNIVNLNVSAYSGADINLYATPTQLDFSCNQNTILVIDPASITITVSGVRA
jgi:hypothetical protein